MNPAAPVTRTDMAKGCVLEMQKSKGPHAYNVSFRDGTLKRGSRRVPRGNGKASFCAGRTFQIARGNILSLPCLYECEGGCHAARGDPGRQIPAGKRTRLPHRHAGLGAPADDAASARPRR